MITVVLVLIILYIVYGYVKLARRIHKLDKQISEHIECMKRERGQQKENENTKN
jgi:hypothetical protein